MEYKKYIIRFLGLLTEEDHEILQKVYSILFSYLRKRGRF